MTDPVARDTHVRLTPEALARLRERAASLADWDDLSLLLAERDALAAVVEAVRPANINQPYEHGRHETDTDDDYFCFACGNRAPFTYDHFCAEVCIHVDDCPTKGAALAEPDAGLRAYRIVERAAHMGGCSQTHHEHLSRDAVKVQLALDAAPARELVSRASRRLRPGGVQAMSADRPMPVGAILASALMAANIACDSGEDVDRFIAELYERGYSFQPYRDDDIETPLESCAGELAECREQLRSLRDALAAYDRAVSKP